MWFQILCLLTVGLEAARVLNPCCKKEYKTHDEYYKDDEYYLPQRYGYGHGNHHHGHDDHSKNVGYKPINPPSNHRETYRAHHNYHNSRLEHYEYDYLKLKLKLDELEHKYQQHDEPHNYDISKTIEYKQINPSLSDLGIRRDDHDYHNIKNEHDVQGYVMPKSQEYAYQQHDQPNHQDHAKHDDYGENYPKKGNSFHDIMPNTYGYGRAHHDHRPQTYLPTIHLKGEHGHEVQVHSKYEYLLPGILRSLQEPAKQDQETLVTIYAYKPKKQHNYPKNFNQTVDILYNREKQHQDNRHTKFGYFDMQDNRQLNYYPKPYRLY